MTTERDVTVNAEQELYVIHHGHGHGYSCLGFDNALDRIERITLELVGRGKLPESYLKDIQAAERGSLALYDHMQNLLNMLERVCESDGERAVYDLSPQLDGLEGWRVDVVRTDGSLASFIVGKSTGWAPCHLEVKRRDSTGGDPADREYTRVTPRERVR